ncbi:MAG: TetR/AcrR family transcriptional regulator [Chloroflexi bacterium]|nr:TetR/AcrR family transcriptional regulator [Chloroflexota bacterium]
MPKRTRSDSSTRLRQILDAAQDILTTGGLESVKIATLAELVGLSEAALYRHVSSKEEILTLVIEDVRATLFNGIDAASTPADKPALRKLEHLMRLHLSWLDGRHGACLMLVTEALQFGDGQAGCESRRLMNDYLESISSIVKEGQRRGEIDPALDATTAATMFIGIEKAAVNRWLLCPGETRPHCKVDELWHMYRSSIALTSKPVPSGRLV